MLATHFCTLLALIVVQDVALANVMGVSQFSRKMPPIFPHILNASDVKVLSAGEDLVLECVGNRYIVWEVIKPTTQGPSPATRHTRQGCRFLPRPTCMQLNVPNAQFYDTGKYICGYPSTPSENLSLFLKFVYVYVYDANHPFLAQENQLYSVSPTQTFVLPCLTTSPSLNVTLWKKSPTTEITQGIASMTFKPSEGFKFKNPPDILDGEVSCRTTGGSVDFRVQNLAAGPPVITNAVDSYVFFPNGNEAWNLICEGRHELVWELPAQLAELSNSSKYVEENEEVLKLETYVKKLTFIHLDVFAAGLYTCRYSNSSTNVFSNVNSDSVFVFLHDEKTMSEEKEPVPLLIPPSSVRENLKVKRHGITYVPQCLSPILGVNMTVWKIFRTFNASTNRTEFQYLELEVDDYWWFNPIRGIAIDTTKNSSLDVSGVICCVATFEHRIWNYCNKLSYEPVSDDPLPEIVPSRSTTSVVGSEVTLVCTVFRGSQRDLIWNHPDIDESRLFKSEVSITDKHPYGAEYRIELTITNLKLTDRGIYTCQYLIDGYQYKKDRYYLDVIESTVVALEPSVDAAYSLNLLAEDSRTKVYGVNVGSSTPVFTFSVKMTSLYPRRRIKAAWTDEEGKIFQNNPYLKIENTGNWSRLTVYQISEETDSGFCRFSARIGEDVTSIVYHMAVLGQKQPVWIYTPITNPVEGQNITLVCKVNDWTLESPIWYLEIDNEFQALENRTGLTVTSPSSYEAVLSLTNVSLSATGDYLCKAKLNLKTHFDIYHNDTIFLNITEATPSSSIFDEMLAMNKPIIIGVSDELEIPSNGTLILTCRGKRQLSWERQMSTFVSEDYEDLAQYVTPKKEESWTKGENYFLKLTLTDIQSYDTGRYICRYLEESESGISVYVLVTNTSAFLPNNKNGGLFMVRRYFRKEPLVLPCQTTLANLNVTLTKYGSTWTPRSSNHNISYDHTVGFTIWAPDEDMEGRYTCEAKFGPKTENVFVAVLDPGNFYPVIMNATEPYLTVPEDFDTMKLVCIGAREVTWDFPSYLPPGSQTRQYVREGPVIPWNSHYVRELTIFDHRSDLTGYYTCRDLQMTKANENLLMDQRSTVFLLFPDEENFMYPVLGKLKAKISLGVVNTYHACIRTSLDVAMFLYKVTKETKRIKNTETMWLDPTKGLVIDTRQPRNYSFLEGSYKCLAVTFKGEKRTRLINLSIDRREKRLTIVPKEKNLHKMGQDLYLTCFISVKKEYQSRIVWKYPFHSSRVLEYNTEEIKEDGVLLGYSRQLVVRRLETSDKGTYTCQARSPDGFLYTENYYLNFNDPSSVELELLQDTFNGNDTLVKVVPVLNNYIVYSRRGSTIKLAVRIKLSGPTIQTQITWYKEDRVDLLLLPGKNVDILSDQNWSNLTLTDLQDESVCLYRLEVRLGDVKDMVNASVRFFKSPEIIVLSSEKFFQFKELFVLSILVKADPVSDEMKITFYSAESMTDCANTESLEEDRNANPSLLKKDGASASTLQGQAVASGCYVFWASNQVGNDTKVFPFAVSKTKEVFLVSASLDNPYEGQELSLICQVNSFGFDDPVWFVKHDHQFTPVTSGIDRNVVSTMDGHTRSATVHFASLSLEDSGAYKCQSLRHLSPTASNRTDREISLDVMELTAPVFLDNATEQVVDEDDDRDYLNCTATGGPSFNVTWYKGSEQVNASEYPGIFGDDPFLLNLQCIEVEDLNITISCEVSNEIGSRSKTFHLLTHVHYREIYRIPDDLGYGIDSILYISLGLGIPFLLVLLGAIIVFRHTIKSRSNGQKLKKRTFRKGPQADESNIPFDINWEFPTNRLTMGPKIGQGAFGKVVRAEAAGIKESEDVSTVAVKMLKPGAGLAQKRALLEELKILILLGRHVNIVNLLGAVTKYMNVKGELFVIVEYCSRGSLRQYLVRHKKSFVNQLDPETGKVNPEITTVTECTEEPCREQSKVSCSNSSGVPATSPKDETDSQPSRLTGTQEKDSGLSLVTENTSGNSITSKQWIAEEDQEDDLLTTSDLLAFAFQCSRGMEYLSSRKVGNVVRRRGHLCVIIVGDLEPAVKVIGEISREWSQQSGTQFLANDAITLVHRDLATRNILLTSDYVIKICDFGLTKDVDYLYNRRADRKNTPLPIRWMAPEAIGQNEFTIKSDVWSFGIMLWEMFSLGLVPYPGVEINEKFYRRLLGGYRLERPCFSPPEIYSIMTECWRFETSSRPNFVELSEKLGAMIESSARQYYLDLNEPFEELNGRDPNYQKLGEILEISVARGDDLGDLCGLPSLDQIEEEEEIRNLKQKESSDASSAEEFSDDEKEGEEELIRGASGPDRKLARKVFIGQNSGSLSVTSKVNSGFDCALPCDGNGESDKCSSNATVNLESLERQVYRL